MSPGCGAEGSGVACFHVLLSFTGCRTEPRKIFLSFVATGIFFPSSLGAWILAAAKAGDSDAGVPMLLLEPKPEIPG